MQRLKITLLKICFSLFYILTFLYLFVIGGSVLFGAEIGIMGLVLFLFPPYGPILLAIAFILGFSQSSNLTNKRYRDLVKVQMLMLVLELSIVSLLFGSQVIEQTKNHFDYKHSQEAVEKKDVSICQSIRQENEVKRCFLNVAVATNDVNLCLTSHLQSYDLYSCLSRVSQNTHDPYICPLIAFDKEEDRCFATFIDMTSYETESDCQNLANQYDASISGQVRAACIGKQHR